MILTIAAMGVEGLLPVQAHGSLHSMQRSHLVLGIYSTRHGAGGQVSLYVVVADP
jgi:hypothetical protein